MPSSTPDDYARLKAPWKPIDKASIKHIIHAGVENDPGNKEEDQAETESIVTIMASNEYGQDENMELSGSDTNYGNNYFGDADSDSNYGNNYFGDSIHEPSDMEDLDITEIDNTDTDEMLDDKSQIDVVGITDKDNDDDEPQPIDMKCKAVSTCLANSGDHRKVVSHVFGRNKASTRELPDNLWIFWCRKHYQRFKYRAEEAENWHQLQLKLVREQLQAFEDWGEVHCWIITLRKHEKYALAKEKKNGVSAQESTLWERFLESHLGLNKTFAQVRRVLALIDSKFNEAEYLNRDKKMKTFPGVEFLPTFQKPKVVKKPKAKKGEVAYKKITLDQPAFVGRSGANKQYYRELAAKKREASSTPQGSNTPFVKESSSDANNTRADSSATKKRKTSTTYNRTSEPADNNRESPNNTTLTPSPKAHPIKRKSMTPIYVASSTYQIKTPPTKRNSMTPNSKSPLPVKQAKAQRTKHRRLTRGYEIHGFDGYETMSMVSDRETGQKMEDDEW